MRRLRSLVRVGGAWCKDRVVDDGVARVLVRDLVDRRAVEAGLEACRDRIEVADRRCLTDVVPNAAGGEVGVDDE